MPPAGYLQETAFAPEAQGPQAATAAARAQLRRRVCADQACGGVDEQLIPWKTGQGGGQVCAMVVVDEAFARAFIASRSASALDAALVAAVGPLLPEGGAVAVDKVIDEGVAGGARARWLAGRLRAAISQGGRTLSALPIDYAGLKLPTGVVAVVNAEAHGRREQGRDVVDVVISVRDARGDRTAVPLHFAAAAAPAAPTPVPTLPATTTPTLSVRIHTRDGGGLCPGERTSATLQSSERVVARVIGLYGNDEALVMFPNASVSSDVITAGQTIHLAGDPKDGGGFMVIPGGADHERIVVVAATDVAGLGALGRLRDTCRLPKKLAAALHRGDGLPSGSVVVSDGYRLLSGEACVGVTPPSAPVLSSHLEALRSLPECP